MSRRFAETGTPECPECGAEEEHYPECSCNLRESLWMPRDREPGDDGYCPSRDDHVHCACWWDGEPCCACKHDGGDVADA